MTDELIERVEARVAAADSLGTTKILLDLADVKELLSAAKVGASDD